MQSFSINAVHDAFSDEVLSITTSGAVSGSSGKINNSSTTPAEYLFATVESGAIYWRDAGTATSSQAHSALAGGNIEIRGSNNVKSFNAISQTGTSLVMVTYAV